MSGTPDEPTHEQAESKAGATKGVGQEPQQDKPVTPKARQAIEVESDPFILNTVFPDAEAIFTFRPRSLEEIRDDCLVVLDANTLLVPYEAKQKPLAEVRRVYQELVKVQRLVIPAQAAREFAKHRAAKLGEIYQQLLRSSTSVQNIVLEHYPSLEAFEGYTKAAKQKDDLNAKIKEYRVTLKGLVEHVHGWEWNDPVSAMYGELFAPNVVLEPEVNHDELRTDLAKRYLHKLPPGYKDSTQSKAAAGDLIIWYTILQLAKTQERDLIFVSEDVKADWRVRSEKQILFPRYELVDEYRRASKGKSLHIIDLSMLLKLFGASDDIVSEIKHSAARSITIQFAEGEVPWIPTQAMASDAVADWVQGQDPNIRSAFRGTEDAGMIELRRDDGSVIRAYTTVVITAADMEHLVHSIVRGITDIEAGVSNSFVVAAVCLSDSEARRLRYHWLDTWSRIDAPAHLVLGYLNAQQLFVTVAEHRTELLDR
jgi:rRNA-processing protein FCF1